MRSKEPITSRKGQTKLSIKKKRQVYDLRAIEGVKDREKKRNKQTQTHKQQQKEISKRKKCDLLELKGLARCRR